MNLFESVFDAVSDYDRRHFLGYVEKNMPIALLRNAVDRVSAGGSWRQQLLATVHFLELHNERHRFWRNPEIFPPMVDLQFATDSATIGQKLGSLSLQLGMVDIERAEGITNGYYRLIHLRGSTYHSDGSRVREVRDGICLHLADFRPVVYFPVDGLFNDLVDARYYPQLQTEYDQARLADRVSAAMWILRAYSPELALEFEEAIKCIVLTPDLGSPDRWSYNCRLRYFGGIFVNPFRTNDLGLVEGFIHEYYHQRFWQWWSYEALDGMRDEGITIRSPITGNQRSIPVMVQALAIYVGVLHFYRFALDHEASWYSSHRDWIRGRVEALSRGIPLLYGTLEDSISGMGKVHEFLVHCMEQFHARCG